MANTNKTITDIIRELRAEADYIEETARSSLKAGENYDGMAFTESDLESALDLAETKRAEADRLEAACKRELSKNASKNGADFGQLGDAAKLREALSLCVDEMCNRCREIAAARGNTMPCLSGCEPVRRGKAALAAPPRNCDVMDWRTAWKIWREKFHPETPVGYSAVVKGTEAFMDWFIAPATEKE